MLLSDDINLRVFMKTAKNIKTINKLISRLKTQILDILFPIECLRCGQEKTWLCFACFNKFKFRENQTCLGCQTLSRHGEFCLFCRQDYSLNGVFIAGDYDDPLLANLIKKFKFYGLKDLAFILSDYLLKALLREQDEWPEFLINILPNLRNIKRNNFWLKCFDSKPLIIPIPLNQKRLNWRGYNQSELLSDAIINKLALSKSISAKQKLNTSTALIKIKNTRPQSSLNLHDRLNNLTGCFIWTGENLMGQNIILIDDIATTGTTLDEAALVLRNAGAGEIWGLALAKG